MPLIIQGWRTAKHLTWQNWVAHSRVVSFKHLTLLLNSLESRSIVWKTFLWALLFNSCLRVRAYVSIFVPTLSQGLSLGARIGSTFRPWAVLNWVKLCISVSTLSRYSIVLISRWLRVDAERAVWSHRLLGNFELILTLYVLNKLLLGHLMEVWRWWGCVAGSLVLFCITVSLHNSFVISIASFFETWLALKATCVYIVCRH